MGKYISLEQQHTTAKAAGERHERAALYYMQLARQSQVPAIQRFNERLALAAQSPVWSDPSKLVGALGVDMTVFQEGLDRVLCQPTQARLRVPGTPPRHALDPVETVLRVTTPRRPQAVKRS